jgi:hypothetical protein
VPLDGIAGSRLAGNTDKNSQPPPLVDSPDYISMYFSFPFIPAQGKNLNQPAENLCIAAFNIFSSTKCFVAVINISLVSKLQQVRVHYIFCALNYSYSLFGDTVNEN